MQNESALARSAALAAALRRGLPAQAHTRKLLTRHYIEEYTEFEGLTHWKKARKGRSCTSHTRHSGCASRKASASLLPSSGLPRELLQASGQGSRWWWAAAAAQALGA